MLNPSVTNNQTMCYFTNAFIFTPVIEETLHFSKSVVKDLGMLDI